MRFLVPSSMLPGGWPESASAYFTGADGRVHPTRTSFEDGVLTCRRPVPESGRLHIAWPVAGFGRPVLCTSSLAEREEPYLLPLELARGKISQVRDQVGAWEIAGMSIGDQFRAQLAQAQRLFFHAVASQAEIDAAVRLADEALAAVSQAIAALAASYTSQRLNVRRQRTHQLPASLGCSLGQSRPAEIHVPFVDAFNAAIVPIEWRNIEPDEGEYHWETNDAQVEWCEKSKLLITGGPLLDLSPAGLPEWLWQWESDFINLQSFVCDFVETAISRYVGRIRHWEVSARGNTGGALQLSEENRLALVARTLEVARQVDHELQLTIRVDEPWGDYQAQGQHRLTPIQFVDALIRSGISLAGVNLEFAVGYRPRGCASRDPLDFSQLLDLWGCLGVPLSVTLAVPSGTDLVPGSRDVEVDSSQWSAPWSEAAQAEWIDTYLPLLVAKQAVVGVYWCQWSDADAHGFPHAGLIRRDGAPKLAFDHITHFRRTAVGHG